MKLAIVSDSHDHIENLDQAVEMIDQMGIRILIHCGDLCSPFMVERLARFSGEVHFVFGNNEGDRITIVETAERFPNVKICGKTGVLDTGSGVIAWTHRPESGDELAASGKYTAVFSGHTHIRRSEKAGDTWHINPGELMGLREDPGFAVFDPETGELEYFDL
ncbi:MAG: YfcE family phosphodiesterase [Candidatus Krumholzibacteriota bacterium]|nr:YfcE family phosphodiesterase [Candidatus Krumholzibacteriota bacterium]